MAVRFINWLQEMRRTALHVAKKQTWPDNVQNSNVARTISGMSSNLSALPECCFLICAIFALKITRRQKNHPSPKKSPVAKKNTHRQKFTRRQQRQNGHSDWD
jgi:hypothetical protein